MSNQVRPFLNIVCIQFDIVWEKPEENLAILGELLNQLEGKQVDLIVLPELFTSGFSMSPTTFAETMDGITISWMKEQAKRFKALIMGSVAIKEKGKYFNRVIAVDPDTNKVWQYDKRHLFRMGGEHDVYQAGREKVVIPFRGWKIAPMVCYDLRFPVWSRRSLKQKPNFDYDVLVYMANWPEKRQLAWQLLLHARAIENAAYVIACNRLGTDGTNTDYIGLSQVIDHRGGILWRAKRNHKLPHIAQIGHEELSSFRNKFPVHLDADV